MGSATLWLLSRTVRGPPIACKYSKLLQDDLLFGAVSLIAELLLPCIDGSLTPSLAV